MSFVIHVPTRKPYIFWCVKLHWYNYHTCSIAWRTDYCLTSQKPGQNKKVRVASSVFVASSSNDQSRQKRMAGYHWYQSNTKWRNNLATITYDSLSCCFVITNVTNMTTWLVLCFIIIIWPLLVNKRDNNIQVSLYDWWLQRVGWLAWQYHYIIKRSDNRTNLKLYIKFNTRCFMTSA